MRSFLLFLVFYLIAVNLHAQSPEDIIDKVNNKVASDHKSFSYDVSVEGTTDTGIIIIDKGKVVVNNSSSIYDDFLFISSLRRDTFCSVKDTLLRVRSGSIYKDYKDKVLKVRLGTSKMFYRCYSPTFRNDTKLINYDRYDNLVLDSTSSDFYFLTLKDTSIVDGAIQTKLVHVTIDKNSLDLITFSMRIDSKFVQLRNVFSFSNWTYFDKPNSSINFVFDSINLKLRDPEYLAQNPTRKMRMDFNESLHLDSLSMIDSNGDTSVIGDLDKRYIVLYFWFKGCIHCKHVGPVIEEFFTSNQRGDLAYLGIETMTKSNEAFKDAVNTNSYKFPNYRYNEGVKGLTVSVAPLVIVYDNYENKVIEQIVGGDSEYRSRFEKVMNRLEK